MTQVVFGVLVVVLVIVAAVAVLGSNRDERPARVPASQEARVRAMTSCAELQAEFDTASANFDAVRPGTDNADASLYFMTLSQDRMEELGCP